MKVYKQITDTYGQYEHTYNEFIGETNDRQEAERWKSQIPGSFITI